MTGLEWFYTFSVHGTHWVLSLAASTLLSVLSGTWLACWVRTALGFLFWALGYLVH